ncbi:hypothetical protein NECAME_11949 [Necator americanus]|uniref:Uncharacterized protein n=1 Tax=Necator americanus TaxID=51031 RepID=W2T2E5_NECAM|nr:hypothetical protein NECAME_11949 [Necator americanus]ETN76073.1 hypothetical protein NECAME_11949 [Necator americanus]
MINASFLQVESTLTNFTNGSEVIDSFEGGHMGKNREQRLVASINTCFTIKRFDDLEVMTYH